jgi:hypothetical protein
MLVGPAAVGLYISLRLPHFHSRTTVRAVVLVSIFFCVFVIYNDGECDKIVT